MAADRTSLEYRRARLRLVVAGAAEQQKAIPALPEGAAGGEIDSWMTMAATELADGRRLGTEIDLLATAALARMKLAKAHLLADAPRPVALAELEIAELDLEALIALLKPSVATRSQRSRPRSRCRSGAWWARSSSLAARRLFARRIPMAKRRTQKGAISAAQKLARQQGQTAP